MKACTVCEKPFEPQRMGQKVCGLRCAAKVPKLAKKAKSAEKRADKIKLKRRADWLKDTERAFNAYICRRDALQPCVSCGCVESPGWHASHYRSVGSSPSIRFDPANVHRSCVKCNLHLHGNPIPYRVELLRRIGPAELERLEGPQEAKKYTLDELAEIRAWCRAQIKQSKSSKEQNGNQP